MDSVIYQNHLKDEFLKYEAMCAQCGQCCGANTNDPCANLEALGNGKYACRAYETRLGIQKTVKGNIFICVSIKDNIQKGFYSSKCTYITTKQEAE
ncbi:MAG: hypothetical protein ISS92_02565 [Candidatus Omnitrophica bacterium]|nr:hypothetical protein [Candidatus Omnitrophota bacterium]